MKYNEANDVNWQALAIEDAQVKIITIAKRAAREFWTKERYVKEILSLIRELIGDLESERLRSKVSVPLMTYAEKTYERQVRLLRENALFYAIVFSALKEGREVPTARKLANQTKKDFSEEYVKSPGFKYWSKQRDLAVYNSALPLGEYHKIYTDRVRNVLREIIASEAKEEYTTNVNLRNIAELTVRYEHQQNMVEQLRASGTKLVYIKAHANCSERCQKYQVGGSMHPSGLYSLDGTTGKTKDGIPYRPLEFATENPVDRHVTRRGKTYQNGCITGFGCRHELEAYKPGQKPHTIPAAVIERRRAVEEKQRDYERRIRYHKHLYAQLSGDSPAEAKKHRLAARDLNEKYQEFSRRNHAAFFRERTRIFDEL